MERISVNPNVLKSARTSINMSLEHVFEKDGIPVETLRAYEDGSLMPTLDDLKRLADRYKCHYLELIWHHEMVYEPLPDLRTDKTPLDSACHFMIRYIRQGQSFLASYYEDQGLYDEKGSEKNQFVGMLRDPNVSFLNGLVKLEDTLRLNSNEKFSNKYKDIDFWIDRVESKLNIRVSSADYEDEGYGISPSILTGFAIADEVVPWIYVNRNCGTSGDLAFHSLIYGVAQIALGISGITNIRCNPPPWDVDGVNRDLYHVAFDLYQILPLDVVCYENPTPLNPIERIRRRNGKSFARDVISGYFSDEITPVQACNLLQCKVDDLYKIEEILNGE